MYQTYHRNFTPLSCHLWWSFADFSKLNWIHKKNSNRIRDQEARFKWHERNVRDWKYFFIPDRIYIAFWKCRGSVEHNLMSIACDDTVCLMYFYVSCVVRTLVAVSRAFGHGKPRSIWVSASGYCDTYSLFKTKNNRLSCYCHTSKHLVQKLHEL